MKAVITFYFLLLSISMPLMVHAQYDKPYWSDRVFRGGLILGLNFSQVDGDTDGGVHKVGMHVGAGSYVSLSERIGMQLDILFSQKGSRFGREYYDPGSGQYLSVYKMKLNYVELPLSLQYYCTPYIHFGAGISFNRLLSSEESWNTLSGWRIFDPEVFRFEPNSWDGFLSASYRLTEALRVEVRYQRSITPIRYGRFVPEQFSSAPTQQNNMIVLRLGYYL